MRIHRIRLANYRGVDAREVTFAEQGVTVVQGPNETGKSSLAEALDLLLEYYDDSRNTSVRAVKPVDRDAGSEVEAELSAGPYRLTYAKRFHRERSTTLTVHAPRSEQLTGRAAHDRVRAILAETVDLPLWQALRFVQGQTIAQPDLAEVSALAAALDHAAAGTQGGDREQSLFERVQREFTQFFTPTGQENAALKALRAEHETAQRDVAQARAALEELETDVERCAAVARELDALRPDHERHRERLAALEARWLDVQQRAAQVERLGLEADRARDALTQAERERDERERLQRAVAAADEAVTALRRDVGAAAPLLETAERSEQDATATAQRLRAALDTARATLREADGALEQSRDAFSLQLLEERWERVAEAQERAAQAHAALAACRIDEEGLRAVEEAHLAVVQARARMEEDGPELRLRADAPTQVELAGEPLHLAAGQERRIPVTEELRLRVAGVEAVLSPGHGSATLRARCDDAERRLGQACAAAGVDGLDAARTALRERQDAERVIEQTESTLRDNLRDLSAEALREKVQRLRGRVVDQPANPDLDAAKAAREAAEAQVRSLEAELAEAQEAAQAAADRRAELRESHTRSQTHLERAESDLSAAEAALAAARDGLPDAALADQLDAGRTAAETAATAHATARDALRADDPDTLEAEVSNARAAGEKRRLELREREHELENLRGRLSARGETGLHDRFAAAQTRAERAATAWRQAERAAAAAKLLHDTLLRHRDAARRAYQAPLREKIEALARIVHGRDVAIELGDDLRIVARTLDGVTVAFDQLSTGAREQLVVLSRLACAALVSGEGGVPVILDDALGWSDPQRLEGMAAALHVAGRDCQVIVLTCLPERYRHVGSATTVTL